MMYPVCIPVYITRYNRKGRTACKKTKSEQKGGTLENNLERYSIHIAFHTCLLQ